MARRQYAKPAPIMIPAERVWAAVALAWRVAGGQYFSVPQVLYGEQGEVVKTIPPNKVLVHQILSGDSEQQVTADDVEKGAEYRQQIHALSFAVLMGRKLNDFLLNLVTLAQKDEVDLNDRFTIGVLACAPKTAIAEKTRAMQDQRLAFANSSHIAKVGERITANVEVIKAVYSQQWNTFYITAITENDQAVWFAYRETIELGKKLSIAGTVKRHADNGQTQLCRVTVKSTL